MHSGLRPEHHKTLEAIKRAKGHFDQPLSIADHHNGQAPPHAAPAGQGYIPSSPNGQHSGHDIALDRLLQAPDLVTLLGLELLEDKYGKRLRLFFVSARAIGAGATSYGAIPPMLRNRSSLLLTDALVQQVVQALSRSRRPERTTFWRAVKALEAFFGTPLVHSRGHGLGFDRLTEAGLHLAKLIEAFFRKYCKT